MAKPMKLELTWTGKEKRTRLEPRILLEDETLSYQVATGKLIGQGDFLNEEVVGNVPPTFNNRLVHGDNLLAIKALEHEFSGKFRCIYVDPPYNTGQAMPDYDDGVEHSLWLSLMRERFEGLRTLLRNDGVFLCQLNDEEMAYAKILLDEVFGRSNFLNHVSVRMKQTAGASGGGEDKRLKKNTEHILIYAKDKIGTDGFTKFNDVFEEEDLFEVIEEMRAEGKSWKYTRVLVELGKRTFFTRTEDGSGEPIDVYIHNQVIIKPITTLAAEEGITERECYVKYFDRVFRDTNAQSSIRTRVMEVASGQGDFFSIDYVPRSGRRKGQKTTLYYKGVNCDLIAWLSDVAVKKKNRIVKLEKAGTYWEGFPLNNLTKEGGVLFPKGKKPEALLQRVLELCTDPGDWVLDTFAGSGTTGAVAHKMRRQWVMVELGPHCHTHIVPRLKRVIDGQDTAGITKAVGWTGGGGFRFMRLAPSLLKRDKWNNWVINPDYNAEMLTEAMCRHMGFTYAPNAAHFWMHGHSTETDFLYVTTGSLSHDQLRTISDDVGPERSLIICCKAFMADAGAFPNLTLKKIPKSILGKCEWDHDDYSFSINVLEEPEESAVLEDADLE
ncbi:site-specific DNA-methyltransferase [Agrobacterium pusense]|uniref:site-specific DNA-methyltransferase n=1 Tax=Agrobacterium pusense TaxID=648995 RepID=UPI0032DA6A14